MQGVRSFPASFWLRLTLLLLFLVLCVFMFYFVEQPIRTGDSSLRLGADTHTYWRLVELIGEGQGTDIQFLALGGNLIGPLVFGLLLKNPFWVMLCNVAFFIVSIQACAAVKGLNRTWLALLLAANATTLVSLITLNKEIFALIATLLLCRYIYTESHSKLLLALILIIGLLARWEQPAITLLFLYLRRENSFFRRHPLVAVLMLLVGISIAYPVALRSSAVDLSWATDQAKEGGAILIFNSVQASFGYALVVIPKALLSLYNRWITPTYFLTDYWQQDFSDFANQFVIHLHCLSLLVISVVAFLRGRISLRRPLPFFIALYLVITSANTFIQPRYQYPVYVLLCFDLARRELLPRPIPFRFQPKRIIPAILSRRRKCVGDLIGAQTIIAKV